MKVLFMNILNQIRVNMLSIISLIVALSALSYNTYRNELTEENRNIRNAGFELLMELNKLQLLVDYAHYANDNKTGSPIKGWSHVLYIDDMSHLISGDILAKSALLRKTWQNEWETIHSEENSNKKITKSIKMLRSAVLKEIERLE